VSTERTSVDVKTETNIWGYQRLVEAYRVLEPVKETRLDIPEWEQLVALGEREEAA
jgi:hypothetical protein